jgi:predicted cupin superfamily sugar epimerase
MQPHDFVEHPEGGRYREVFRSTSRIDLAGRGPRSTLTHIYFSLDPGEVSLFHRVDSDEVWNLYRGPGVRLLLWDADAGDTVEEVVLSAAAANYCHVVPAGVWQAALPMGETVLVGCSVAPGFEFDDFSLLRDHPVAAARLVGKHPALSALVDG